MVMSAAAALATAGRLLFATAGLRLFLLLFAAAILLLFTSARCVAAATTVTMEQAAVATTAAATATTEETAMAAAAAVATEGVRLRFETDQNDGHCRQSQYQLQYIALHQNTSKHMDKKLERSTVVVIARWTTNEDLRSC
jgi:hypothetical protein